MSDIFKTLEELLGEKSPRESGASEALTMLAQMSAGRDPQAVVEYVRPHTDLKFAQMRVGFEGCDDDDALVALALIDSLWLFTNFSYENPSTSMAKVLAAAVTAYTDATAVVAAAIREMSLVRARALGRKIPVIEDFKPKSEDGGNSGVADRVAPTAPTFIHPQNERKV